MKPKTDTAWVTINLRLDSQEMQGKTKSYYNKKEVALKHLMVFGYIQRLVPCSVIIRKSSLETDGIDRDIHNQHADNERQILGCLSLNLTSLLNPSPQSSVTPTKFDSERELEKMEDTKKTRLLTSTVYMYI